MAKHGVQFEVPQQELGKADVVFRVKQGSSMFGTMTVSSGSIVWFPRGCSYGYKMGWERFNKLMAEFAIREEKRAPKNRTANRKATKKTAKKKAAKRVSGSGKELEAVYVGMDHPLAMANGCTYKHRLRVWEKGLLKNPAHVVSLETGKVYRSIRELHAANKKGA